MKRYAIKYDKKIIGHLKKIPLDARKRIDAAISHLASDPRPDGYKKLQGVSNLYRVRVGDYCICYEIDDALLIIILVVVAHRKDVYDLL